MVIKNGETVLSKQYGYADVENKIPITDQTIFRAFSMTKPITAAALMTLYEQGKFQLDDKVSDYIPEFAETQVYNPETKKLEPQEKPMTIRNLLTHVITSYSIHYTKLYDIQTTRSPPPRSSR